MNYLKRDAGYGQSAAESSIAGLVQGPLPAFVPKHLMLSQVERVRVILNEVMPMWPPISQLVAHGVVPYQALGDQ